MPQRANFIVRVRNTASRYGILQQPANYLQRVGALAVRMTSIQWESSGNCGSNRVQSLASIGSYKQAKLLILLVFHGSSGRSSMVELLLPKQIAWVRFPSPAPNVFAQQFAAVQKSLNNQQFSGFFFLSRSLLSDDFRSRSRVSLRGMLPPCTPIPRHAL